MEPETATVKEEANKHAQSDYHRLDEQVNICLESKTGPMKPLKRKFIRCSSLATINHMKKYLAKKLYNNLDKYKDVSIIYLCVYYFQQMWIDKCLSSKIHLYFLD